MAVQQSFNVRLSMPHCGLPVRRHLARPWPLPSHVPSSHAPRTYHQVPQAQALSAVPKALQQQQQCVLGPQHKSSSPCAPFSRGTQCIGGLQQRRWPLTTCLAQRSSSRHTSRTPRPAPSPQRAAQGNGSGSSTARRIAARAERAREPSADGSSELGAGSSEDLGPGGSREHSAEGSRAHGAAGSSESGAGASSQHSAERRPQGHREANPQSSTQGTPRDSDSLPSMEEVVSSVRERGVDVALSEFGPFFSLEATSVATGEKLGSANGFVRPTLRGRLLHLDTIRLEGMGMRRAPSVRTVLGMGFLMGAVLVRHGVDRGCARAELLAINDNDEFHAKLVKYYQRLGWRVTDVVTGERLSDMGHMLVWGGVGTKMECDTHDILAKWSNSFKKQT